MSVEILNENECNQRLGFEMHSSQMCAVATRGGMHNFVESDVNIEWKIQYFNLILHAEKKFEKTGSLVLIFITWLFGKFYKMFCSINRFSARFRYDPVKSTKYEKIQVW